MKKGTRFTSPVLYKHTNQFKGNHRVSCKAQTFETAMGKNGTCQDAGTGENLQKGFPVAQKIFPGMKK